MLSDWILTGPRARHVQCLSGFGWERELVSASGEDQPLAERPQRMD